VSSNEASQAPGCKVGSQQLVHRQQQRTLRTARRVACAAAAAEKGESSCQLLLHIHARRQVQHGHLGSGLSPPWQ